MRGAPRTCQILGKAATISPQVAGWVEAARAALGVWKNLSCEILDFPQVTSDTCKNEFLRIGFVLLQQDRSIKRRFKSENWGAMRALCTASAALRRRSLRQGI